MDSMTDGCDSSLLNEERDDLLALLDEIQKTYSPPTPRVTMIESPCSRPKKETGLVTGAGESTALMPFSTSTRTSSPSYYGNAHLSATSDANRPTSTTSRNTSGVPIAAAATAADSNSARTTTGDEQPLSTSSRKHRWNALVRNSAPLAFDDSADVNCITTTAATLQPRSKCRKKPKKKAKAAETNGCSVEDSSTTNDGRQSTDAGLLLSMLSASNLVDGETEASTTESCRRENYRCNSVASVSSTSSSSSSETVYSSSLASPSPPTSPPRKRLRSQCHADRRSNDCDRCCEDCDDCSDSCYRRRHRRHRRHARRHRLPSCHCQRSRRHGRRHHDDVWCQQRRPSPSHQQSARSPRPPSVRTRPSERVVYSNTGYTQLQPSYVRQSQPQLSTVRQAAAASTYGQRASVFDGPLVGSVPLLTGYIKQEPPDVGYDRRSPAVSASSIATSSTSFAIPVARANYYSSIRSSTLGETPGAPREECWQIPLDRIEGAPVPTDPRRLRRRRTLPQAHDNDELESGKDSDTAVGTLKLLPISVQQSTVSSLSDDAASQPTETTPIESYHQSRIHPVKLTYLQNQVPSLLQSELGRAPMQGELSVICDHLELSTATTEHAWTLWQRHRDAAKPTIADACRSALRSSRYLSFMLDAESVRSVIPASIVRTLHILLYWLQSAVSHLLFQSHHSDFARLKATIPAQTDETGSDDAVEPYVPTCPRPTSAASDTPRPTSASARLCDVISAQPSHMAATPDVSPLVAPGVFLRRDLSERTSATSSTCQPDAVTTSSHSSADADGGNKGSSVREEEVLVSTTHYEHMRHIIDSFDHSINAARLLDSSIDCSQLLSGVDRHTPKFGDDPLVVTRYLRAAIAVIRDRQHHLYHHHYHHHQQQKQRPDRVLT